MRLLHSFHVLPLVAVVIAIVVSLGQAFGSHGWVRQQRRLVEKDNTLLSWLLSVVHPHQERRHALYLSRGNAPERAVIRYYDYCNNKGENNQLQDENDNMEFGRSHPYDDDDDDDDDLDARRAAEETWNWCQHFVVPHHLCPWAAASVQTRNAVQIHVVVGPPSFPKVVVSPGKTTTTQLWERVIHHVANDFYQQLLRQEVDANTAIAFVVLATDRNSDNDHPDFDSFYDWFVELEDQWLSHATIGTMEDHITLAPFHPDWHFQPQANDDDVHSSLDFEKKSPFPTISIVASEAIDQAGEAVTQQIGMQNAKLLQSKSVREWEVLYDQAVRFPTSDSSTT